MNKSSRKIKEEIRISGGKAAPVHVPAYKKQIEENLEVSTTDLLAVIFSGAVSLGASDIHIEPSEKEVEMRIRLDGMLHPVLKFDKKTYKRISSRLKLISGLKLNISDRPQDGRFTVVLEKKDLNIEIRISSLPAEHGETFVMRILNPEALREIEKLGLREDLLKEVKKAIKQPHGMILSTGPTGSGKTTTLYAFCKKINSPEKKIVTIEDPIEYHLEGISQTQVDPKKGYDFASGLRAIVRQDPDVILVGEMRDAETVNIALQAALTGHLVFSTLHTNSAAGVVTRLLSLKGKIANIGPALNIVLGQRLLRKVCEDCKKMRKVKNKELEKLKKELEPLKKLGIKMPEINDSLEIPEAEGCKKCNFTGYRGRSGIFEILKVGDEMEEFIMKKPGIAELQKEAKKKGMTTLKQDGLLKVARKETTIKEVERITG